MLKLSLVTPSKKLVTDLSVDEVFLPSYKGEINVLSGHGPLMSTLSTGVLKYRKSGEEKFEFFSISWGYLEISGDRVTVLAETAESALEIDLERAREAKAKAETALSRTDTEQKEFQKNLLKLERAMIRIQIAGKDEKNQTTH